MLQRLDALDRAIAETEVRIVEQTLLVLQLEAMEQDATAAKRMLGIVEGLLVEYHHARRLVNEARELTGSKRPPAVSKRRKRRRPLT